MNAIFQLLVGVILACATFGTMLWCLYQAVQLTGWRRWVHAGYIPVIGAGFMPIVYENPNALMVIAIAMIAIAPLFVFTNKWPTVLLVIPPLVLSYIFLRFPTVLLEAT